jgi:alkylation response protein AidB-like acyl-CoA dehydrogenase
MDFELSEEQRLLCETIERLLVDRYGFDKQRRYLAGPDGWSRDLWAQYAELGAFGSALCRE